MTPRRWFSALFDRALGAPVSCSRALASPTVEKLCGLFHNFCRAGLAKKSCTRGLLSDFTRAGVPDKLLHSAWRAEKVFFRVKLSVPGTCRAEDVTEYFKIGEASPEGFFKSVLTFQDVVATGRYIQRHLFNEPEARQARCHMGNFPTHGRAPHGPSAGGPGRSPRIPQGKGVLIGRIATRHSGFDTSSVISLGVCARARTKSLHSSSRVVSALPCVGRANARDPHTKDTVEEATGSPNEEPRETAMDAPFCCLPLFAWKRELTEDIGTRLCGRFTVHKEGGRER